MKVHPIITAFVNALEKTELDKTKVCVVSDILWNKKNSEYMGLDLFHTTRGRTIAFGTGLKLGNLGLKVVAFAGDLATIGGNHFIHAARRNMDITVICINNFIYKMIGGKNAPLRGEGRGEPTVSPTFSLFGNVEQPFNIPHLAKSCGAVYVARWTILHKQKLMNSIAETLQKTGFSMIEVISPGKSCFAEINNSKEEFDLIEFYYKNSEIKNDEDTKNIGIEQDKKIIVGKFVDRERPTFIDSYNNQLANVMGDKFKPYGSK
ncbi:2-oxoacid:ferredoxin oxidoreductase subunit beta [candidate division WOR-3 bacterium]|nr:2-oxoacid:ferredoxin oxidoreductase subunit beta [candidate division WOR-3 bacterium]